MTDIYISVDIEADGPIPGDYSMTQLGACVVDSTQLNFKRNLKPISDRFVPRANKVSGLNRDWLIRHGDNPKKVMREFRDWVGQVSGDKHPVFVAFNATFDWMFTHWYFEHFGVDDPFGISGLDIKAFYMALIGSSSWSETSKKNILPMFKGSSPHTHDALDDAIEQAELFKNLFNFGQHSFFRDARNSVFSGRG